MSQLRIVEVDWVFSCNHTGWHSRQEAHKREVARCMTIGYLVSSSRTHLTIAQCRADKGDGDEEVENCFVIPRACVKKIRFLHEKE